VMPPDRIVHPFTLQQATTARLLLASMAAPQRLDASSHQTRPELLFCTNATTIRDAPRFRHRGLLIDTGRHFLPLRIIKARSETLVARSIIHWHGRLDV